MFFVGYEKRAKKSLSQLPQGRLTPSISASFALAKDKLPHYGTPPLPSGSGLSNFSQGMPQVISVCFLRHNSNNVLLMQALYVCV